MAKPSDSEITLADLFQKEGAEDFAENLKAFNLTETQIFNFWDNSNHRHLLTRKIHFVIKWLENSPTEQKESRIEATAAALTRFLKKYKNINRAGPIEKLIQVIYPFTEFKPQIIEAQNQLGHQRVTGPRQ